MTDALALLAALAFALGSVLQQKGTLEAPSGGDDPRFLIRSSIVPSGLPEVDFRSAAGCSRPLLLTRVR